MSSPDPRHDPEREYSSEDPSKAEKAKVSRDYRGAGHRAFNKAHPEIVGFRKQMKKTLKSSKARNKALKRLMG